MNRLTSIGSIPRKVSHNLSSYVCMAITYNKGRDQPGKVANPARGQLNM